MSRVYLDYAGASPVDERVLEAMKPFILKPGNPLALHEEGQLAKRKIEEARQYIAHLINADNPDGVIFTSGATESNNLAIIGMGERLKNEGRHIVTSNIEHISVINSLKKLEKNGFEVTRVPVDEQGIIRLDLLEEAVREDTVLITIQAANSEIGVIQPLEEIGRIAEQHNILFHCDATAGLGQMPLDVKKANISLLTMSANSIYGPQGVGALYLASNVRPIPQILGGGQQRGFRSGTENVAGIIGMGEAAKIAALEMRGEWERLKSLRDRLIREIPVRVRDAHLNGHPVKRTPNNVNFRIDYVEGESIVLSLDILAGIAVSTGASCASLTLEPSHVILALGVPPEKAQGLLQVTMGRFTLEDDVNRLLEALPSVVDRLRRMSPLTPANYFEKEG